MDGPSDMAQAESDGIKASFSKLQNLINQQFGTLLIKPEFRHLQPFHWCNNFCNQLNWTFFKNAVQ